MQESMADERNEFEFVYARTPEELESLSDSWQLLHQNQDSPALDSNIDYYKSILASKNGAARPYIVMLRKQNCPVAMVVGRIEKHQLHCKLGYRTICKFSVPAMIIVYGGILGRLDETLARVLFQELTNILRRREADILCFQYLKTGTIVHNMVKTIPALLCRNLLNKVDVHWRMTIPHNINEFYQARTSNHRRNLRKKIRKLESAFPGQVRVVNYRSERELAYSLPIAEEIDMHTYQHSLGVGLANNPENRNILQTAAKMGWLRMSILFVKDSAWAFQWGLHYGNTFFLRQLGYHPDWADWNVGTVLFIKVLEDLCADPTVQSWDFAFGDADYKRNYSDRQWREETIYVFAPRITPVMINGLKSATDVLDVALSWLVAKAGFYKKIKKLWRRRLQKRPPASN